MKILNSIGAIANILMGLLGLFFPDAAAKFVSIIPDGKRGISDIRATYGGVFLGAGAAAIYLQDQNVFTALGIAWAAAAIARIFSIFIDKSYDKLNFGGILFEGSIAALLLFR